MKRMALTSLPAVVLSSLPSPPVLAASLPAVFAGRHGNICRDGHVRVAVVAEGVAGRHTLPLSLTGPGLPLRWFRSCRPAQTTQDGSGLCLCFITFRRFISIYDDCLWFSC